MWNTLDLIQNNLEEKRIQVNMSNQTFFLHDDLSWESGDLQIYDNQSGFASSVIFTIVNSVIALMTFIVHKAVYKLLAKLPDRSINQIIYPSMVSVNLNSAHKKYHTLKYPQSISKLLFTLQRCS